jgi:ubiquinone/menaquinone biosynthesis C-methylase UbiE
MYATFSWEAVGNLRHMHCVNKKHLKEFYEKEAERLSHQEIMYLRGNKHELWWHRKRLYYILSFLSEIFEKNNVLAFADIGCAEGFYIRHISSIHSETFCIGADVARVYVKKAKMSGKRSNTEYVVCDIENLPFKDGSIDVLLCSEVLEHVYNYRNALVELCRVGKKSLVISFPGHSYLYRITNKIRSVKKLSLKLSLDVGHVSEVTVQGTQVLLKDKCKSLEMKVGGALPLQLFQIIPSIRLVEIIDNLICKALERFGAASNTTIHVIKIVK